ncbi:MAG: sulfatase-like hydrolase/transferase [Planctomycetes bacterium]|nr:sulfatase-like hydrolase/transferase [Planctomycetota bacterium]
MSVAKNLLMVIVDCLRADAVYGPKNSAQTPHIDALCKRSVCFANTITSATYTTPSIASFLTGLFPCAHGVRSLHSDKLAPEYPSLPGVLRESGYHTAAFLSGPLGKETGLDQLFERFEFRPPEEAVFGNWGRDFLKTFPADLREPWFTMIHLWELHEPIRVAPECDRRDCGRTAYERALSSIDPFIGGVLEKVDPAKTLVVLTGDHGCQLPNAPRAAAAATLKWLRLHLGPFRSIAKKILGVKRTPRKIEHFGMSHGYHVYDFLARVPLTIADGERWNANHVVSDQVRTIDLFPTLLALLSIDIPQDRDIQGQDLLPLVSGEAADLRPALIETRAKDFRELLLGIRSPGWKYAFGPNSPDVPCSLYDLTNDPDERVDVLEKHPEKAEEMRAEATRLLDEGQKLRHPGIPLSALEKEIVHQRLRQLGYL